MSEPLNPEPSAPPKPPSPTSFRFTQEMPALGMGGTVRGMRALDGSLRATLRVPNINDRLRERQRRLQVDTEVLTGGQRHQKGGVDSHTDAEPHTTIIRS